MTDTMTDYAMGSFAAAGCSESYCANNPAYSRTYEAYRGALCGSCEDTEAQDYRDRNYDPDGPEDFDDD